MNIYILYDIPKYVSCEKLLKFHVTGHLRKCEKCHPKYRHKMSTFVRLLPVNRGGQRPLKFSTVLESQGSVWL